MIQEHGITFNESDLGAMTGAVQQAIRRMRKLKHSEYSGARAGPIFDRRRFPQLSTLWKDVLSDSPRATAERRSYGGNLV